MAHRESTEFEDATLLSAVSVGDERAFVALYERFSGPVYSLLMKMLRNEEDAEEILQTVFLQVWRRAEGFRAERCSVFTWIVIIARSRAIDRLRQRQRQARTLDEAEREEWSPSEGDSEDNHHADERVAVTSALAEIPAEQRQAIEMAFFQGMSQTEISEALAEPLGTIKARIRRGMLRLRDYLGRRL